MISPANFSRAAQLAKLDPSKVWDCIVVGGGATGLGIAVDAANRGLAVLLLEQSDFAKATSSRATKLVHGGVRYLAQGQIKLVYNALHERGLLLQNAPHLVSRQDFLIPCFGVFEKAKYFAGLMLYQLLSGKYSFGRVEFLKADSLLRDIPVLKKNGLTGGVRYYDGQFDDARLALVLAKTAVEQGATVLNYLAVGGMLHQPDGTHQVLAKDRETSHEYRIRTRTLINATGVFVDDVLHMDDPGAAPTVRPSQGVHLVLDKSFLPGSHALMIPKTSDGRVLFCVPWQGHVLAGTTDTPVPEHSTEPRALEAEIAFILQTLQKYLVRAPERRDVLSVFAGLRPLAAGKPGEPTKEVSREHKISVSPSGLISITGGKWTTYRKMGEDAVDHAIRIGQLTAGVCQTRSLKLHGYRIPENAKPLIPGYGSDAGFVAQIAARDPSLANLLLPDFPYTAAMVIWAVREEMARTLEDVLARRFRLLFLDARAAIAVSQTVAGIMAGELGESTGWIEKQVQAFHELAAGYLIPL